MKPDPLGKAEERLEDPLERGNLKARMPDRFADLKAAFEAWDAAMLHDPSAPSFGASPSQMADHFGPAPPPPR